MFVTVSFGAIGFADDYLKLTKKNPKGLSSRKKLVWQAVISVVAGYIIESIAPANLAGQVAVPFFKNVLVDAGIFFIPFVVIVMVGRVERGEFHRWAGWARDRADHDRGGMLCADYVPRR